jgi:Flp pilus assembly protein TadD
VWKRYRGVQARPPRARQPLRAAEAIQEAVIEYRAAVKDDPKFGQARFKLAEAYLAFGDERNAYGEAIRGADLLSDNADAQVLAIKMLLRAGSYMDAKTRRTGS